MAFLDSRVAAFFFQSPLLVFGVKWMETHSNWRSRFVMLMSVETPRIGTILASMLCSNKGRPSRNTDTANAHSAAIPIHLAATLWCLFNLI